MNYIFGVVFLLLCIFLVLIITQRNIYTKKNNEMNILQIYDPDPDTLFDLYQQCLPIIIQKELQNWDGIDLMIGLDYNTIETTIQDNMDDILTIIKGNLQFHNNILSYDWKVDLTVITTNINSPIYPIHQVNLLQLFATVTGEARIVIFCPKTEKYLKPFTNNVSSINIKPEIEKDETDIDFIEVVLREGNLIYIPYGWYYFIYGNHLDTDTDADTDADTGEPKQKTENKKETIILDCINKSFIDII
jgi:hypothetical protein